MAMIRAPDDFLVNPFVTHQVKDEFLYTYFLGLYIKLSVMLITKISWIDFSF